MSKNMVAKVRPTSVAVLVLFWGWEMGESHLQIVVRKLQGLGWGSQRKAPMFE